MIGVRGESVSFRETLLQMAGSVNHLEQIASFHVEPIGEDDEVEAEVGASGRVFDGGDQSRSVRRLCKSLSDWHRSRTIEKAGLLRLPVRVQIFVGELE